MSVQTQIDRIEQNVANTYDVLVELGADMPTEQNSDNLAGTAGTVKAVLYSKQTLTETQKAQARENIGVSVVNNFTTTEEGFVADARALKVLHDNMQPTLVYNGVINGVSVCIKTIGRLCFLKFTSKGDTQISSFQLPYGIGAESSHLFIGKAYHPQLGDIWYQPFFISEDGVVSARSQNNNSDIAVSWIDASAVFILK